MNNKERIISHNTRLQNISSELDTLPEYENIDSELDTQELSIADIKEALVGKVEGATATADTILEGYSAYVGQTLVNGTYIPQNITIDGVKVNGELHLVSDIRDIKLTNTPKGALGCSLVVLNGEIHQVGGSDGNYNYTTQHCKWDGTTWTEVSTLPIAFNGSSTCGRAVVLNNEIHILSNTNHYKWDGTTWTKVSTLPYNFKYGDAVVLNNEIHIFGGSSYQTQHYKWDGTSWTSVSTLPVTFYYDSVVVLNNEIHIICSNDSHYKWDGTTWTSVSTLPISFDYCNCVVLNNEIHIFTGLYHYKWDCISWTEVSTLPFEHRRGGGVVVFDGEIYTLSGTSGTAGVDYKAFYVLQRLSYLPTV